MKVAYIFEQFPCPSETFALREIESLRRRGFDITVLCVRRCGDGSDVAGAARIVAAPKRFSRRWFVALGHVFFHRWKRLPNLTALWWRLAIRSPRRAARLLLDLPMIGEFAKVMAKEHIHHVHGYWLGQPGRLAAATSAVTGATMSLSGHARDIFTETVTLDVLARRAEFIAVCTEQGLHHLRQTLGSKDSPKLHLVRHGLLSEEMSEVQAGDGDRNGHSARAGDADSLRQIVAIGRLVEKKGFDVLLHAFKQVIQQRGDVRLTIIGDGPLEESLKTLDSELSVAGSVTFAGWLDHREAMRCLQYASVLAVPSVVAVDGDRDGVPNVILEAFACGVPVVASRLNGIAEAVEHEVSGLLADPGEPASLADALCRILGDRSLVERLAHGGRRVLRERFDASANSGQLAALFAEAMSSS